MAELEIEFATRFSPLQFTLELKSLVARLIPSSRERARREAEVTRAGLADPIVDLEVFLRDLAGAFERREASHGSDAEVEGPAPSGVEGSRAEGLPYGWRGYLLRWNYRLAPSRSALISESGYLVESLFRELLSNPIEGVRVSDIRLNP